MKRKKRNREGGISKRFRAKREMVNIKWKMGRRISQDTRNRKPVYTVGTFQFSTKKNEAPFRLKSDLGLDLDCTTYFRFKTSIKSCECS